MRVQSKAHHLRPNLALVATLTIGMMPAGSIFASSPAAETAIVLKPAPGARPLGLAVALFAPDATIKSSVESLKPEQSWPVTGLTVSLNSNTGLCGDHSIAHIIELPNQDKDQTNPDGPDCIFGALLTIEAGPQKFEIATECGDWTDNAALCWGYGQTGEFRLLREQPAASPKFRLVFPGPAAVAAKPSAAPPNADDPAAQRHGLFLDTLLDDKKVNKGDLWLVWTSATVEISYTR